MASLQNNTIHKFPKQSPNCTPSFLFKTQKKKPTYSISSSPTKQASMASSSSSSATSFTVTHEQFKLFHNIDRILFTKLVHNLSRSPIESMQVIALWIWLEHSGQCRHLVNTILAWPDTLISSLADEAVLCLSCLVTDESFPFSLQNIELVPLTQSITKSRVSLSFFRVNRFKILHGVTKNVNEVCVRAFKDLVPHEVQNKAITGDKINTENVLSHKLFSQYFQGFDLRHMQISSSNSENGNEEIIMPPDERTIFLTFSKGYPISENEIRDFFIRKFGECIEAVHMQEVATLLKQPLYARLIVHSASLMDVVLEGKNKAKFSINGKHVWARRYVRKFHRSPPQPSSPSQPSSAQT